jgi:hypothetical protein
MDGRYAIEEAKERREPVSVILAVDGRRRWSMRLLPMKGIGVDVRRGEPVFSLMCGVPSLAMGLMALVLITSYLIDKPVGPPQFYRTHQFPYAPGSSVAVSRTLPSEVLLGILCAGALCGGIGLVIADGPGSVRQAVTSIAGIVANLLAFILAWISYAVAAAY